MEEVAGPPQGLTIAGGGNGGTGNSLIKRRLYRGKTGSQIIVLSGGSRILDGLSGRKGGLAELLVHGQCPTDLSDGRPSNRAVQGTHADIAFSTQG